MIISLILRLIDDASMENPLEGYKSSDVNTEMLFEQDERIEDLTASSSHVFSDGKVRRAISYQWRNC
jgi:hypothetical protein